MLLLCRDVCSISSFPLDADERNQKKKKNADKSAGEFLGKAHSLTRIPRIGLSASLRV